MAFLHHSFAGFETESLKLKDQVHYVVANFVKYDRIAALAQLQILIMLCPRQLRLFLIYILCWPAELKLLGKSVSREQGGTYTCVVSNAFGEARADAVVNVLRKWFLL